MSTTTAIEWTQVTWNPVTGCDRVSPGCDHCYALTLAKRLKAMGNPKYQRDGAPATSGPGFGVSLHHDTLTRPLMWRAPRTVFVNSMSDLFHTDVPDEYIEQVFTVMALGGQHTFQVLTKRHGRMRSLLSSDWFAEAVRERYADHHAGDWSFTWPLPNVWLGVSAEDQRWADIRIPALLNTPAAVRFVSAEPLLGQITLNQAAGQGAGGLDWVIVGGESGPSARPIQRAWVRSLRDHCVHHRVPLFFKQWGGRTPKAGGRDLDGRTWDQTPTTPTARPSTEGGL